jgi:hypothetical protein
MKVETRVDVLQVVAGDVTNAAKAVAQGAAMNIQRASGLVIMSAGVKVATIPAG